MAHATTGSRVVLAAVVRAQCAAVSAEWPRAMRGDARAIHRLRTATRRLRELLPIVDAAAPGGGADRLRRDARRLTRALGTVREIDVAMALLEQGAGGPAWIGPQAERVRRELMADRARAAAVLRARLGALDPAGWRARARALSAAIDARPAARVREQALARRVRRRAARVTSAITAAGTLYAPEALHRVRIATKKLRYSLELSRDVAGAPVGAMVDPLKVVQDRLGRIHDLNVVEHRVRSMAWSDGLRSTLQSRAALEAALGAECRAQHAAFLAGRDDLLVLARKAGRLVAAGLTGRRQPVRMKLTMKPARAVKSVVGLR